MRTTLTLDDDVVARLHATLGNLRPGLNLDNVGELLEIAEGPMHR